MSPDDALKTHGYCFALNKYEVAPTDKMRFIDDSTRGCFWVCSLLSIRLESVSCRECNDSFGLEIDRNCLVTKEIMFTARYFFLAFIVRFVSCLHHN